MNRVITSFEAQSCIRNIVANPGEYSVFDYAYAYALADKFSKIEAMSVETTKPQTVEEFWITAKEYITLLLEENEEFAGVQAVEICQKVTETGEIRDQEELVRLLYLAFAYLDVCYAETGAADPFWQCIYNACAIVFGIDDYQPGKSFLSSFEEIKEHRAYLKSMLPDAKNEQEQDALLDGILALDKVLKNAPPQS